MKYDVIIYIWGSSTYSSRQASVLVSNLHQICCKWTKTKLHWNVCIYFWMHITHIIHILIQNIFLWALWKSRRFIVHECPLLTNLPSASSCPSTSNRNLFRCFGGPPRSKVLLKERSVLFTIWLIFWNRLENCRWKQNKTEWVREQYSLPL